MTSATHPLTFDQTFTYDPVGNRPTNASLYNIGNQLTDDTNFTYTYDLNGNLTRKTFKSSGNHTDYTYDAENRLIRVDEFAAGSSTPGATSTYRYDGLGRRIEKVGNGITRRYIYDAGGILLEYDGNNDLQARYTPGPGIDRPIAMARGGNNYFYHSDGLGSITELTDSSGTIVNSYAYDAYGNIIQQTSTIENPYTYTGREFDSETGMYYYRARYYDPRIGRFLSKDPIGLRGGVNVYAYVNDNPLNYTDPLGLLGIPFLPLGGLLGTDNGNLWPGYRPQDEICTIPGALGDYMNSRPCIKKCCKEHDECYKKYKCNASSWFHLPTGACNFCNIKAESCVLTANKSRGGCGCSE